MRRMLLVLVVVVAAMGTAVAGCGDSDGTDTTGSLTKAEFVKEADAICARLNKKLGEEVEEVSRELGQQAAANQEKLIEVIEDLAVPTMKTQLEELEALPVPEGEEEQVELILERQEESIEKVEDDPLFRASGDPYEELNQPAIDYGMPECAE